MSDRFLRTTVALGVFALVALLATGPAHASNMGFKLERDLQFQTGYGNYFYISVPFYRSFPEWDGQAGISSDDVLLDFWLHSHDGSGLTPDQLGYMSIETFDNDPTDTIGADNSWYNREIFGDGSGSYIISGNLATPFSVDDSAAGGPPGWRGYRVITSDLGLPGQTVNHNIVIVGSHNPAISSITMPLQAAYLNYYVVSIPYHTTFNNSDEVLCNLWSATFGGTCDAVAAAGGGDASATDPNDPTATVIMQCFDNVPGGTLPADNSFYDRQIFFVPGTGAMISGTAPAAYPVTPGESYQFNIEGDRTVIPGGAYDLAMPHY